MTIQITKPKVEALINQRLQTGGFKDVEDVVSRRFSRRLRRRLPRPNSTRRPAKDIVELFAPLRGLNLDFGRNHEPLIG